MSDERGFTLIEVIIAFMIMAVSMIAVINCLYIGSRQIAVANTYGRALSIAQNKVEEIKHKPFNQVLDEVLTALPAGSDICSTNCFLYSVTVDNTTANLKTITVSVFGGMDTEALVVLTCDISKR